MRLSRVLLAISALATTARRLRLLAPGLAMERAKAAAWDATVTACSCWPTLASCRQAQILGNRRVGKSPSVRLI
jgi:hypothetical protein